jgi:dTDP-glucose 4,6-dehydratase/UDP-glucuronate decarboxylase
VVAQDLAEICARAEPGIHALAGRTVLVAGAAGFLPGCLVDALARANRTVLSEPCRVVGVDNLATGTPERLAHLDDDPHVVVAHRDLTAELTIDEPVDYVVHGASIASPTWYRRHPLATVDVNVTGTRQLLDLALAHRVRDFVYLSSSEIYGDPPAAHIPTGEDYRGSVSCTGPRACYDESKRLAETLCSIYQRELGLRTVQARPFNVYGPGLRPGDGRAVPDFLDDAVAGRPITLYSDGRGTRSFCYLTDAVTALLLLLTEESAVGPYNVGNDEERTIAEVAETVDLLRDARAGVAFASNPDPHYLTDSPARRCPDLTRITSAIDWSPRIDLRTGLERTLRHQREEDSR